MYSFESDYNKELERESCSNIPRRLEEQFPNWFKKRDHNGDGIDFYGILHNILELDYLFGPSSYLIPIKWYMDDPFVLAIQAHQVFYVDDYKLGANWKVVQKIQHRHLWDVPMNDGTGETTQSIDNVYQENESSDIQCVVEESLESCQFIRLDTNPDELDTNTMNKERQTSEVEVHEVHDVEEEDDTLINYCTDAEETSQIDNASDDE
ncbi:hypothetical protein Dsin_002277 [Dipteronia sinensis]|uniref:DUF4216 domain-containing protein n=1 Tax=Dipteronia sinensis TaxID=43782 RepID=A0AAE0B5G7_9ROSI|nr:hypothetical protein Dsin_002277 [Dipteronia sinensis]